MIELLVGLEPAIRLSRFSGLRPLIGNSLTWRGETELLNSPFDALTTSAPAVTTTVSVILPISSVAFNV